MQVKQAVPPTALQENTQQPELALVQIALPVNTILPQVNLLVLIVRQVNIKQVPVKHLVQIV